MHFLFEAFLAMAASVVVIVVFLGVRQAIEERWETRYRPFLRAPFVDMWRSHALTEAEAWKFWMCVRIWGSLVLCAAVALGALLSWWLDGPWPFATGVIAGILTRWAIGWFAVRRLDRSRTHDGWG